MGMASHAQANEGGMVEGSQEWMSSLLHMVYVTYVKRLQQVSTATYPPPLGDVGMSRKFAVNCVSRGQFLQCTLPSKDNHLLGLVNGMLLAMSVADAL